MKGRSSQTAAGPKMARNSRPSDPIVKTICAAAATANSAVMPVARMTMLRRPLMTRPVASHERASKQSDFAEMVDYLELCGITRERGVVLDEVRLEETRVVRGLADRRVPLHGR